jgi:CRISPR-associated protein Cas2
MILTLTPMPYLICYDIEDNKWRKKVSDHLLAYGLERVQYSVFVGPLAVTAFRHLRQWLEEVVPKLEGSNDSILILQLTRHQIEKMSILGNSNLDVQMLAGTKNTLFL